MCNIIPSWHVTMVTALTTLPAEFAPSDGAHRARQSDDEVERDDEGARGRTVRGRVNVRRRTKMRGRVAVRVR
jgi:hypothetical protein